LLTAKDGSAARQQVSFAIVGETGKAARMGSTMIGLGTRLIMAAGLWLLATLPLAAQPAPAVVMMHGRAGAYGSSAKVYDAAHLAVRHSFWGQEWARSGRIALLVDGFGPRGFPAGFPRGSYEDRPAELNEVTVRPRDAYGALAYLRARSDVRADAIGLQGWSNGGSATLAAMDGEASGLAQSPSAGFKAALVFYPACGLKGLFAERAFKPYAPTLILHGSADEEVSPGRCRDLAQRGRAQGGDVSFVLYPGATHGFDSPARSRQRVEANAQATADAVVRAHQLFDRLLPP
jgi:dienelactone hydrolase